MPDQISNLAKAYFQSVSVTEHIRNQIVTLMKEADAANMFDEEGREIALREIQRELYKATLVQRLRDTGAHYSENHADLLCEAERILDSARNPDLRENVPPDTRSPSEERMYGALRVRWFELMKAADLKGLRKGPAR